MHMHLYTCLHPLSTSYYMCLFSTIQLISLSKGQAVRI
jgi:hypothetical protein